MITGFYTFGRQIENLFWVIEYPSVEAAERAWRRETEGTSTPRNTCFDLASLYQRQAKLVVEVPTNTLGSELVLFELEDLTRYELVGDLWTYLDLAEAVEAAGLIWGGHGDNFTACSGPGRRDVAGLTRAEVYDEGLGKNVRIAVSRAQRTDGSSLPFEVFLYSSIEARANQWEVDEDGTARSDACGYEDDVLAAENVASAGAGNIVVVTHEAGHEAWPRLVAVLDELGGQTE